MAIWRRPDIPGAEGASCISVESLRQKDRYHKVLVFLQGSIFRDPFFSEKSDAIAEPVNGKWITGNNGLFFGIILIKYGGNYEYQ